MQLGYEKLDVYQASIQFLGIAFQIMQNMPQGYSFMIDQFKRASLSIPLNIAEGSGKSGKQDQARFYKIARGSACECGAILDAALAISLIQQSSFIKGKELLHRIISMLSKMF